jgi:predicted methyltransferase
VEALPGDGWYTKILAEYIGPDGKVIGADYAQDMWPLFGGFATEEFVEGRQNWVADWTGEANAWSETDAPIDAFKFGSLPAEMNGTADAVLFIRALHNMSRFEADGGYLTTGVQDAFDVLKPGGVVGVVQHRAPDANSDEWAVGSAGYLKESRVIDAFTAAGFVFEGGAEINANPADQPTEEDVVWRLPPSLGTSADNEELKAQMTAIGESDRMTLKFRKPE